MTPVPANLRRLKRAIARYLAADKVYDFGIAQEKPQGNLMSLSTLPEKWHTITQKANKTLSDNFSSLQT